MQSQKRGLALSESKGFTLIELLVVIAIIGLLASIVLASLNSARKKSRDARRLADLKQLQNAMELYANDNSGKYPDVATVGATEAISTISGAGLGSAYIAAIPDDPLGGSNHYYWISNAAADSTSFCIGAIMEGQPPTPDDTCDSALSGFIDGDQAATNYWVGSQ